MKKVEDILSATIIVYYTVCHIIVIILLFMEIYVSVALLTREMGPQIIPALLFTLGYG